jgi:hypothetical protein
MFFCHLDLSYISISVLMEKSEALRPLSGRGLTPCRGAAARGTGLRRRGRRRG